MTMVACCPIRQSLTIPRHLIACSCIWIALGGSASSLSWAEPVAAVSSWHVPSIADVRKQLDGWLRDRSLTEEQRRAVDMIWNEPTSIPSSAELFDRVTRVIALADPTVATWIEHCQQLSAPEMIQDAQALANDSSLPPFVRHHLELLYLKSFVWLEMYDEAAVHVSRIEFSNVVDPSAFLFYRGIVEYRLRQKEAGLQTLARLLENESILPRRFVNIARLMQADLKAYEEETLDEVARLMDSIRIRLRHGRAGKRVRDEEDAVIAKLDKMIDELEKQRQQMQSQSGGGAARPQSPAQDSSLPGARGQGDVDRKDKSGDVDWGNLPPKEREEALQQLGEDYPAHYREVIEEYFRSLAKEE